MKMIKFRGFRAIGDHDQSNNHHHYLYNQCRLTATKSEVDEGDSDGIIPVTDSEVDEMVEDAVERDLEAAKANECIFAF